MNHIDNPYLLYPVRVEQIVTETEDQKLKTFKLVFLNPEEEKKFKYIPGQFAELSVPGKGEIPIGIASSPTEKGFLSSTVNEVGVVTTHLHDNHGEKDEHLPPFAGSIDWPGTLKALAQAPAAPQGLPMVLELKDSGRAGDPAG